MNITYFGCSMLNFNPSKFCMCVDLYRPSPQYQRNARKDPPRRNEPSKPSSRVSGGRGPSDRRGDGRGAGGRGGARGSDKDKGKGGKQDKVRVSLHKISLT